MAFYRDAAGRLERNFCFEGENDGIESGDEPVLIIFESIIILAPRTANGNFEIGSFAGII